MKNFNIKKIGIIALSGACDEQRVLGAKNYFENQGIKVELSKNIFDVNRYLAGSDDIKVEELHRFFADKSIDLILNARGGYGCIRLLNKIDYDLIKKNPKPFCGFSDITTLLLMIYKNTGIITYHSPMACSDFSEKINNNTYKRFKAAVCGQELVFKGEKIFCGGQAAGIIWGGNLASVVSLCGLDFIPDKDFIFFTEDLNEPVYKIDRMFTQLLNMNSFKKHCKGIVLGEFIKLDNEEWFNDLIIELSKELNIPTIGGFKITHGEEKITIPVGKSAQISGNELILR